MLNCLIFRPYRHDYANWIEHRHRQNIPEHRITSFTSYRATEQRHNWNKICCGDFELLLRLRLRLRSQVQSPLHHSSMSCHERGDPNRMPPYPSPLTGASPASKVPGDITSSGVRSSEFGIVGSFRRPLSTMLISMSHHQIYEKRV